MHEKDLAEAAARASSDHIVWVKTFWQAVSFICVGVAIAAGQILQAKDPVTWKEAIGRCITTGGLALVAGGVVMLFPGLPFIAQISVAAMLASLGNSGLELFLHHFLKIKTCRTKR